MTRQPPSHTEDEHNRVLSALWAVRREREIADRREKELVKLGRAIGIPMTRMANALDLPVTTLWTRFKQDWKFTTRSHERRHKRGNMDPGIDQQLYGYMPGNTGYEREIKAILDRGQVLKVCQHKATEPCNDTCEVRTPGNG